MKVLCPLAAFSVALFLTACTSTRKAEDGAAVSTKAEQLVERPGNIFNTRGRKAAPKAEETTAETTTQAETQTADTPTDETQATAAATNESPTAAPVPTEAQQKAAEELLSARPKEAPAAAASAPASPAEAPSNEPAEPEMPTLAPLSQGLRMGSIVPAEEAASSADAPAPAANSVELRGLRSPKLPTALPMGIDGKLQNAR